MGWVGAVLAAALCLAAADGARVRALDVMRNRIASYGELYTEEHNAVRAATGATGATGPNADGVDGALPSDKIVGELAEKPLATGATATEGTETGPVSFTSGPAAKGSKVSAQFGLGGYTVATFEEDAQLAFRKSVAAVLGIDTALVKIDAVSADSGPDLHPRNPSATKKASRRRLLGGRVLVDFTAAVASGKGTSAAGKLKASVGSGKFAKKLVANGADANVVVAITVEPKSDTPESDKPDKIWRKGAGHWHWIDSPNRYGNAAGGPKAAAAAKSVGL